MKAHNRVWPTNTEGARTAVVRYNVCSQPTFNVINAVNQSYVHVRDIHPLFGYHPVK